MQGKEDRQVKAELLHQKQGWAAASLGRGFCPCLRARSRLGVELTFYLERKDMVTKGIVPVSDPQAHSCQVASGYPSVPTRCLHQAAPAVAPAASFL